MPEKHYTVTISSLTIVKIVIVLLALVFLYIVRDIVLVLFLALIFASAIDPWVDWFERRKMPRWLGMLVMYIAFFSIIILIFVQLIPALREQVNQVTTYFPKYYESVQTVIGNFQLSTPQNTQSSDTLHQSLQGVSDQINKWTNPSNLFSAASGVIGSVAMFVLVLVLTFYLVVEDRGMKRALRAVTPDKIQPYLTQLLSRIQTKMGLWLRGQIILSFIIFAFTWIGLTILGVPYSLLLALIAGIFEIVPFL
ncbi:MAG TPA: AI-2E family transporter, partial [Patescibacteria group bacterium]|nr:AI-2E family transporter [Patescibacteria group bacterium]